MTEQSSLPCVVTVDDAGLPHRTPAMVERDRHAVRMHAHYLAGTSARGRRPDVPPFTAGQLLDALRGEGGTRDAAFLAGRCRAPEPDEDAALTEALRVAMRSHATPGVRVEAAMSLALRGSDREEARDALAAVAGGAQIDDTWIAAGYGAQLGDVSGWPALLRALSPEVILAYRTAAAKRLVDFVALRGQACALDTIDPWSVLARLSRDPDAGLRQVIPNALLEAEHPDARALLTELSADNDSSVKLLANHTLRRLP